MHNPKTKHGIVKRLNAIGIYTCVISNRINLIKLDCTVRDSECIHDELGFMKNKNNSILLYSLNLENGILRGYIILKD